MLFSIQTAVDTMCINGCKESIYFIGLVVNIDFFFVFKDTVAPKFMGLHLTGVSYRGATFVNGNHQW